jgi:hypothetical protein
VFDISDWDYRKPFIILPKKQFNNSDLSKEIESIIEGKVSQTKKRNNAEACKETVWELFRLINTKLTVNFAIVSTIVYASMVYDAIMDDSRLPKMSDSKGMGIMKNTIPTRSLGAFFAYQNITKQLINPNSFFPLHRPNSVMDVFLAPAETIKHFYGT